MPPEQARGEPLEHRTDLFSFGVVLYQMTYMFELSHVEWFDPGHSNEAIGFRPHDRREGDQMTRALILAPAVALSVSLPAAQARPGGDRAGATEGNEDLSEHRRRV